jgi:hypothetical protein
MPVHIEDLKKSQEAVLKASKAHLEKVDLPDRIIEFLKRNNDFAYSPAEIKEVIELEEITRPISLYGSSLRLSFKSTLEDLVKSGIIKRRWYDDDYYYSFD